MNDVSETYAVYSVSVIISFVEKHGIYIHCGPIATS
jgi:hypothetical protein